MDSFVNERYESILGVWDETIGEGKEEEINAKQWLNALAET